MPIHITQAEPSDGPIIAGLVGELLQEIMAAIGTTVFQSSDRDRDALTTLAGRQDLYGIAGLRGHDCDGFSDVD